MTDDTADIFDLSDPEVVVDEPAPTSPLLRALFAVLALGILVPLTLLAAHAAGASPRAVGLAVAIVAAIGIPVVWFGTPSPLPSFTGSGRFLLLLFILVSVLASLRVLGTGTFMLDSTDQRWAYARTGDFAVTHNCFTCLAVGSELAAHGGEDVYDQSRYRGATGADQTPVHEEIGGRFTVDGLPYPPPALLPAHLLRQTGADFSQMRAYWFVFSVFVLVAAMVLATRYAGGLGDYRSLLLFPAVLLLPNVVISLQIGNVQTVVIAMTLLGMLCFAKGYHATGAILLAYPLVTKIWPSAFLLYFLVGRRWRALFATAVAAGLYKLAAFAAFGPQPYIDFLHEQLPSLMNGQAFSFMKEAESARLVNMSIFGWPQKLFELGYTREHTLLPGALKWGYAGFLVGMVALVGWRFAGREREDRFDRLTAVRTWLALMTLAQLLSPFLPFEYGVLSTILLLGCLLPRGGWFRTTLIVLAMMVVGADAPLFATPERMDWNRWHVLAGSAIAFLASVLALIPAILGRHRED